MFFGRKNFNLNIPKKSVAIIGDSSLALMLADILLQNNNDIIMLSASGRLGKGRQNSNFTIKNMGFQTRCVDFCFTDCLMKRVDYCFFAPSAEDYRTDLLLLTDSFLKGVPVVDFSSLYGVSEVEKIIKSERIKAYFTGFFMRNKNTIQLLVRTPEIKIASENETAQEVKKLFDGQKIGVELVRDSEDLFWQNYIPFVLGNLLLVAYGKNISEILSDAELRKSVDAVILEMKSLAVAAKANPDMTKVLPDIYAFPDGVVSEFANKKGFMQISSLLSNVDRESFPALKDLLSKAVKKI